MVEIKNVSKKFGRLEALKDINLTLKKGACVALIGPNGCGKTTLIKTILGMVIPDKGEVFCNGKSTKQDHTYRANVGYMPQIGRYPENMNIGQILNMVKELRKGHQGSLDEDLLTAFKLEEMAKKNMRTLSGGTTQKVSAAIAFLFNPSILILDEPTAGLDPMASDVLKDKILKEREKGKLILITSHLLAELDELINEVIFMHEGKVMLHRSVVDLKEETGEAKISRAIASIIKSRT